MATKSVSSTPRSSAPKRSSSPPKASTKVSTTAKVSPNKPAAPARPAEKVSVSQEARTPETPSKAGTLVRGLSQNFGTPAASAAPAKDQPSDLRHLADKGSLDYYKERAEDFKRRNPGQEPPDYYLQYGDKYARRFTDELRPTLSEGGQKWLDDGRKRLQQAIEDKRAQDPKAFAELERDPEKFKAFAYGTHADAYLGAGLSKLPSVKQDTVVGGIKDIATGIGDYAKILSTPDFKDLLGSWNGIKQVGQIGGGVLDRWVSRDPATPPVEGTLAPHVLGVP